MIGPSAEASTWLWKLQEQFQQLRFMIRELGNPPQEYVSFASHLPYLLNWLEDLIDDPEKMVRQPHALHITKYRDELKQKLSFTTPEILLLDDLCRGVIRLERYVGLPFTPHDFALDVIEGYASLEGAINRGVTLSESLFTNFKAKLGDSPKVVRRQEVVIAELAFLDVLNEGGLGWRNLESQPTIGERPRRYTR